MNIQEQMQEARKLEKHGEIGDAAQIYQRVFDRDPENRLAIGRLLIIYRKLKEYRKELEVIDGAMTAYRQHQKAVQEKWIRDHPSAAGIGRSMLRQWERVADKDVALATDPTVGGWLKRMEFVNRKISGKKAAPRKSKKPSKASHAKQEIHPKKAKPAKIVPAAKEVLSRLPSKKHPSLFIISLTYLVPMEKIDNAMARHVSYLNRHYVKGDFLVSGRKVPRTGGIIIARGGDRQEIEKIVKEDPFIKGKLAMAEIQEFSASQVRKGLKLLK